MRVTSIEPLTRNAEGQLLSGNCEFTDGKRWRFIRVGCDGTYCFLIDSGVPSQWGWGNYGRTVAYPKRVEALKEKLMELGELISDNRLFT